jgi:hypothetical protein
VVEQPTRRRDQNLDSRLQLERLRLHVDAAVDHRHAQLRMGGVALDVGSDLIGELAGRGDHEGAHRVARRRHAAVGVRQHLVKQRQRERRGLPGPGLGGTHDVAAGKHVGDRLRLDRRHHGVALIGDGSLQARVESDARELERRCRNERLGTGGTGIGVQRGTGLGIRHSVLYFGHRRLSRFGASASCQSTVRAVDYLCALRHLLRVVQVV